MAPKEELPSVASYPDGLVVIGPLSSVSGKIDACRILVVHGVLPADVVTEMLIVRDGGAVKGAMARGLKCAVVTAGSIGAATVITGFAMAARSAANAATAD